MLSILPRKCSVGLTTTGGGNSFLISRTKLSSFLLLSSKHDETIPLSSASFSLRSYSSQKNSWSLLLGGASLNRLNNNSIWHRKFATLSPSLRQQKAAKQSEEVAKHGEYRSVTEEILLSQHRTEPPKTTTQKVVQGTKDVTYISLAVGAVVIVAGLAFYVFRELFSSESPQVIYSRSLKYVLNSDEVENVFGVGIKAYGEETRRGRRRHVENAQFVDEKGRKRIRMMYHIKGPMARGKVNLEMCQDETGGLDYRYMYVESEEYPPKVIVLVDNRSQMS